MKNLFYLLICLFIISFKSYSQKKNCDSITSVTITSYPKDSICIGTNIKLIATVNNNATPPFSYHWFYGEVTIGNSISTSTTFSINYAPVSGKYSCVVSNTCNNKSVTSLAISLTVNITPNITINPNPAYICPGFSVMLTVSGANTYTWSPQTGLSTTLGATVIASPTVTTTYTVTGTMNGCTDTASVIVYVDNIQTAISKYKNKLCFDDTMKVVDIASNGIPPYTYQWYPGNYTTQTIILKNTQDTLSVHNYEVTVKDSHNCKDSTAFSIAYLPGIKIQELADSSCPGICNAQIVLKVKDSDGNTDINGKLCKYLWSNLETTKDDSLLCSGIYKVTVTDQNNCKVMLDSITVPSLLTDTSNSVSPLAGYSPLNVHFVYYGKFYNIIWVFGDGDSSQMPNVVHSYNYNPNNSHNGITSYYGELIIKNNKCIDTINFVIDVKKFDLVNNYSNPLNYINIYPNPANDIVTIEYKGYSGKDKAIVGLYNITGELIKTQQIKGKLTQISISDLAEGVYIVKIINDDLVGVKRVIKE